MSQAVMERPAWRAKRQLKRARRQESAVARVAVPIPEAIKDRDPIAAGAKTSSGTIQLVIFLIAAVVLHGGILVMFFGASTMVAAFEKRAKIVEEKIEMAIVEPPPPPPPPPPVEPPPPEPEVEEPTTKPKAVAPPPPDPINLPEKPPPEPPKDVAPRRIVGLSLESTVGGEGSGPSFAVGNTRMGQTEKTATDAKEVTELPKDVAPPPPTTNRAATRIPTGGTGPTIVKPKRIGAAIKPAYPEIYKAQDIEADVVVEVIIAADGKVKSVRIVSPAPQPEFNEAARAAALQEVFSPAEKDGKPIEWTLTFTVRFRLND